MTIDYRIKLRWLIVFSSIIRCVFANLVELGNDEVYYYTYALQPDWNHFDHPPLVGLLIRFFTLNLNWVNDFSMRLGPICLAAINTWLIACIARTILNERAGLIAAILFTASIFSSIISGIFILPDSVANTFWLAAIYSMVIIIKTENSTNQSSQLLLLGLWIGLACLSKVNAIFLWFGFFGYICFHQRNLLQKKAFYLGIAISILCILPILIWNLEYDFITYKFHSERVSLWNSDIRLDYFMQTFFGQIFYNNPLLIYLYIIMLIQIFKNKIRIRGLDKNIVLVLLYCSFPIILTTTGISLFRQTLPHWSGAGFFSLMILTALWVEIRIAHNDIPKTRKILNMLLNFILAIMIITVLLLKFYPGNLTGKGNEIELGKGDVSLDLTGWKNLEKQFYELRAKQIINGEMNANDPLLVYNWFPGGHILYYIARPLNMRLVAEGSITNLHKFIWLNHMTDPIHPNENAYLIVPSNNFVEPKEIYSGYFNEYIQSAVLEQKRGNRVIRKWYIYQLKGAKHLIGNKYPKDYLLLNEQ